MTRTRCRIAATATGCGGLDGFGSISGKVLSGEARRSHLGALKPERDDFGITIGGASIIGGVSGLGGGLGRR